MDKIKTVAILGRQKSLGLAELESLYGAEHVRSLGDNAAVLDIPATEMDFRRLGGAVKLAQVLAELPTTNWPDMVKFLGDKIPEHIQYMPEGTFTLGVSVYGIVVKLETLNRNLLGIKKIIKAAGKSTRIVPNKSLGLNSAQVLHNKLTTKGGWELIYIRDGEHTLLAQTLFIQDIEAYAARDQARPKRDARVGMLPPKLAQIMVNLASGKVGSPVTSHQSTVTGQTTGDRPLVTNKPLVLLDPFCGTGVILQEALLMGYTVYGTDAEPRMIDYTKANLDWLDLRGASKEGRIELEVGDATKHQWAPPPNLVASETYLGRPFTSPPRPEILTQNISDCNVIIKKFLSNIHSQLESGTRLCLAVPAWQVQPGVFKHLPLIDQVGNLGYNRLSFVHVKDQDLIYYRPDQIVGRELIILARV